MKSEGLLSATQLPIRYIKIFFRRKWLLLIPLVVSVVGGIVTGALLPKIYQSYSVVMIEEEKTLNPLISGIAVSADVVSRMRNIREQILGWNSLVQLVDRLQLAKNIKSQYEYEQLVLGLRGKIDVRMQGPNLIKITYTSEDPAEAKKVVQTVNDIFVEENMKAQNKESTIAIEFLKDQIKVYRRKIKEAEIADMRDKLSELLVDSTEEHPLVIDYRRKIADMEAQLKSEDFDVDSAQPIPTAASPYANVIKEQIDTALQQVQAQASTATKNLVPLDKLNPSATGSNEALYQILLLDKMDSTVARDAQVNENIYNMLLQRLETAKITQRLEASKQGTRYTVLDPPRLPLKPIRPNKPLIVFLGAFLGISLGVGLVLLSEFTDRSILSIDDAKEFLEYPILGGISKILTEEDIAVSRSRSRFRMFVFVSISFMLILITGLYSLLQKP
ncbi:MAG: GNVR domain-containing protein [Deltaproteobacteria bacterium]